MNKIKMLILFIKNAKNIKNKLKFIHYSFVNFMNSLGCSFNCNDVIEIEFKELKMNFKAFSAELAPYLDIWVERVYEYDQLFIPNENDVIFDVGSNIGFYSVRQAKKTVNGKVYSFEPNPYAFERLKRNVVLNNLENVVVNNLALGEKSGKIQFNFDMSTTTGMVSGDKGAFEVERINIDEYIKKNNIQRINIMKIDTEGSEFEILKGAKESLKIIDKIVMEYHSEELKSDVTTFLKEKGFNKIIDRNLILYFIKDKSRSCNG